MVLSRNRKALCPEYRSIPAVVELELVKLKLYVREVFTLQIELAHRSIGNIYTAEEINNRFVVRKQISISRL